MAFHPTSVNNTFARHFVLWIFFLSFLSVLLIPLFLTNRPTIDPKETQMLIDSGRDHNEVMLSANNIYSKLFLSTGIYQGTVDFFSGKNARNYRDKNGIIAAQWIDKVWYLIFKAVWRLLALASLFYLPVLFLCIPAVMDGYMVRARKSYRFENQNTISFYMSGHMAVMGFGVIFYLLFLPVTITTTLLSGLMIMFTAGLWLATANFQKK